MTWQQSNQENVRTCDAIILGHGLAGCCLAWELFNRNKSFVIIDRDEEVTSSKIAGGMISPMAGRRHALSWRYQEMFAAAVSRYRSVEEITSSHIFTLWPYYRVFKDTKDRQRFEKRDPTETSFLNWRILEPEDIPLELIRAPWGACWIPEVGQLNVPQLIQESRQFWISHSCYISSEIDLDTDIRLTQDGVEIPHLELRTQKLICCRGAEERNSEWFNQICFLPAKGEILTCTLAPWCSNSIVNEKVWVVPADQGTFRVGATFDSQTLDQIPTEAGREDLLKRLSNLAPGIKVEIVHHRAGIRPATDDQKPVVGFLKDHPEIGIINGLGSKGSLQAPWIAKHLVDHWLKGSAIDPVIALDRKK